MGGWPKISLVDDLELRHAMLDVCTTKRGTCGFQRRSKYCRTLTSNTPDRRNPPLRVGIEVHPTTPWNYALQLDTEHPENSVRFEARPLGQCPFSPAGAPIGAQVRGRPVPAWQMEHNAAGPLPVSPVQSGEPSEMLTLIPYGCTNLRITEFPHLAVEVDGQPAAGPSRRASSLSCSHARGRIGVNHSLMA